MKIFKKHVSASDLWVKSNERLSDFYASSWQRGESAVVMLVLRALLAAAAVGVLVWSLTHRSGASPYWLTYLTNWGLLSNCLFTLSALIVSCTATIKKLPEYEVTPWYIQMYWFFYNVGITVAFLITLLYWTLLFEANKEIDAPSLWLDISTHAFNSCVCAVELLAARTPVRALHFYQPLAVGMWYAIFSGVYYAAGGTDAYGNPFIYPVLDWREPTNSSIVIVLSILGVTVIYFVVFLVALVRDKVSKKYIREIGHDLPPTHILPK